MLARNTILQSRYRIVRPLGKGGMGQVYEAIDDTVDSIVAIKETFANTDRLRNAFEHEAKLLASLRHPVLPRVMHHFFQGDRQFLVMDFIEGLNLAQLLELRGLPFKYQSIVPWADKLLDALSYLHRQYEPIIHRDIKPANIKVTSEGEVFLLDFGLAKGAPGQDTSSVHGYTAAYAPLEQLNNSGTNAQSDLYSLAATLYHLLTANLPVQASKRNSVLEEGRPDPLIPVHRLNPEVPEAISAIVLQAMAMKRRARFDSAIDMRRLLSEAAATIERKREREILDKSTLLEVDQAGPPPTEAAADFQFQQQGARAVPFDIHLDTITGMPPVVPPPPSDSSQQSWPSRIESESQEAKAKAQEQHKRETDAAERLRAEEERQRREAQERLEREEKETQRRQAALAKERKEQARKQAEEQHLREEEAERMRVAAEERRRHEEEQARLEAERLQREAEEKQAAERRKQMEEQARVRATAEARRRASAQATEAQESDRAVDSKLPISRTPKVVIILGVLVLLVISVFVVWRLAGGSGTGPPPGMALVPGGEFMMGRDDGDEYERPAHKVTVKPFFIDLYEVTREDYKKCVDAGRCYAQPVSINDSNSKLPATGISWDGAAQYAIWIGKRLPTEEEWEFAARGTDGRRYPWGSDWKQGFANANGASGGFAEVGSFKGASPYGVFDMVGNAWEWTASDLKAYPGGRLSEHPRDGVKVIRGGNYKSDSSSATTTYRWGLLRMQDPSNYTTTGFRCVKDVPATAQ